MEVEREELGCLRSGSLQVFRICRFSKPIGLSPKSVTVVGFEITRHQSQLRHARHDIDLGHHIPMINTTSVEIFQSQNCFSDIPFRPLLRQRSNGFDQGSTITAIQIFHNKIQVVFALERVVELHNEGRFRLFHENHPSRLDVGDLILRDHVCFAKDLDSVVVPRDLLLGQEYRPEGTFADGSNDIKVFDG